MDCDICGLPASKTRRLNCVTCARSAVFGTRVELAATLFDKEEKAKRVEAVVSGNTNIDLPAVVLDGVVVDTRDCVKAFISSQTKAQLTRLDESRRNLRKEQQTLQAKLNDYKTQIQEMKTAIARRKSDRESAGFELGSRTSAEIDNIQKTTRRMIRRWDFRHDEFVRGRMSLCREAARLARLHKERVVEGHLILEKFTIAHRLPIPDLRDMNNANPAELTAALTQVTYLVSRVSTYLAVRLPAEIVLPGPDQPHPMIFYPGPSYAAIMSSASAPSSGTNLSSGNAATARPPRGRVIQTTVPLAKLQKENRNAFFMFVEGVTLLAWDIAWLCRTQGMRGFNDWTEICPIGKNLHLLLLADHRAAARMQRDSGGTPSGIDTPDSHSAKTSALKDQPNYPSRFGQLSHGTAHSFLGTHEGSQIMRDWKLGFSQKFMDKIKQHLIAEIQGAEWEVVQDRGWGKDGSSILHDDEEPVVIRQRNFSTGQKQDTNAGKDTDRWTRLEAMN
jgi:Vacuolar sorting 38 and autophagy-related subunit 14